MKKSIVFDLDGTLVDTHKALESLVKDENPNFSVERILTYDFNKSLDFSKAPQWFLDTMEYEKLGHRNYGLNVERKVLINLLSDLRLFRKAELFDSVHDTLPSIAEYYEIIFHSFAYTREIANYKSVIIDSYFKNKFDYTMITSIGIKKPCILNADFVVEDNLFDLEGYIGSGTKLLLIDRPYNQELYNQDLSSVFENSLRLKNIEKCFDYLLNIVE